MAPRRPLLRATLVATALALLLGCGKKGPLVPPEALAPAAIGNLSVVQQGGRFQVSWSAPGRQEGGDRLEDLAGFLLFKRTLLPPAEDCETCPSAYTEVAHVDLDYPKGVKRLGNRYLFEDYDLKQGKAYQYKVRSFNTDGVQSTDSNKARHTALAAPLPPVVEALPSATGLVLAFVALPPDEGSITGYNIYRSKAGSPMPTAPLNAKPLNAKTYEDKDLLVGVRYSYTVTSVVTVNGESAESDPSNQVEATLPERD